MKASRVVALAAFVMLAGAALLAWEIRDDPDVALVPFVTPPAPGDARTVTPVATATPAPTVAPPTKAEESVHHTLDPCTALRARQLPPDFQTLTVDGITIAWDPSITIEATTLAYLTEGLLAQAAQLIGTSTRTELAVVIYPTLAEFREQSHAPAWAGGLYDGAVRIPARTSADLGVAMETLRHEIMHALLHAEVGCMPVWLDEGLAQYFAHEPTDDKWLQMLAGEPAPSLASMQVSSIVEVDANKPEAAYAQSLAMTQFAIEHHAGIPELLRDLRRGAPLELWKRIFSTIGDRDVLEAISLRMLGLPLGHAQEQMVAGGVCCTQGSGVAVTCTAAHNKPADRTMWVENHHLCKVIQR